MKKSLFFDFQLFAMNEEELFYVLALQKVELVGDIVAKKLLTHFGSAKEIFQSKAVKLQSIDGIGSILIRNLKDKSVFQKVETELQFIKENHIETLYFKDENYPEKLKHCIDGPVLLFASGNFDLKNRKIISIVGTRQITSYGMECCKKLIADLAPLNPIIVSGFAYGVDIVAHQFAMDYNLQTIGVLAHGLNQIYPRTHKKYMSKMEENGGFISEFWSDTNPDKERFVRRNRIVAGMSDATIVVETAIKGGSMITANLAFDYNREVFAVPGKIHDSKSKGCLALIKRNKAHLYHDVENLLEQMGWPLAAQNSPQKELEFTFSPDSKSVLAHIEAHGPIHRELIANELKINTSKLSNLLLSLEMNGEIQLLAGNRYAVR